jgi:hypothetical protein
LRSDEDEDVLRTLAGFTRIEVIGGCCVVAATPVRLGVAGGDETSVCEEVGFELD